MTPCPYCRKPFGMRELRMHITLCRKTGTPGEMELLTRRIGELEARLQALEATIRPKR